MFLTLNWKDLLKGCLVALLTVLIGGLLEYFNQGMLPTWPQLYSVFISGAIAGIAYLLRNIYTNLTNNDTLLNKTSALTSDFGAINVKDFARGIALAFLTVFLQGLYNILDNGIFPTLNQLKDIALTGLSAMGAYMLKNLFTDNTNNKAYLTK